MDVTVCDNEDTGTRSKRLTQVESRRTDETECEEKHREKVDNQCRGLRQEKRRADIMQNEAKESVQMDTRRKGLTRKKGRRMYETQSAAKEGVDVETRSKGLTRAKKRRMGETEGETKERVDVETRSKRLTTAKKRRMGETEGETKERVEVETRSKGLTRAKKRRVGETECETKERVEVEIGSMELSLGKRQRSQVEISAGSRQMKVEKKNEGSNMTRKRPKKGFKRAQVETKTQLKVRTDAPVSECQRDIGTRDKVVATLRKGRYKIERGNEEGSTHPKRTRNVYQVNSGKRRSLRITERNLELQHEIAERMSFKQRTKYDEMSARKEKKAINSGAVLRKWGRSDTSKRMRTLNQGVKRMKHDARGEKKLKGKQISNKKTKERMGKWHHGVPCSTATRNTLSALGDVATEDAQTADTVEEEESETDEENEEDRSLTLGAAAVSTAVTKLTRRIVEQGTYVCQEPVMSLMTSQSQTQEMDTSWVPTSSGAPSTIQYNVLQVKQRFGDVTMKGARNVTFGGTQNIGKSQACPQEDEKKLLTKVQKIRKQTESKIQSWTQGMVKTQAHQEVMEKIDRGAIWVTIKGRPGEGKSTVAYMALRDLHSQGRQVFQVVSPDEFNDVTRTCANPVIMLDDIFGDLEFDVAEWTKWRPSLRPILDHPDLELNGALNKLTDISPEQNRKKQSLFILVGRDHVLKASLPDLGRVRDYLTSSKHLVELSPTRHHEEKLNILKSVFRKEDVDIEKKVILKLSHIACPHGFPHVCKLFATAFKQNAKVSAKEFFTSPLEFLNQTLQKLINNKSKYQLLKAMIQGDGKVSQSELYKDKYKMHDCVSSANELVGSYLKLEDGTYMFDHPSIYDSVAFLLTEKDPVFVIENCSLSFINQRLRHGTVENQGLVAEIPPFCIDNLVQRFALGIKQGNLAHVIPHQICCDPDFIDKLMNILNVQYQISVYAFLRYSDKETLQSCLELLPSNKSSTMVKYILEKGNITLQQMEIDEILLGVCKHAAGNVLTYLTQHVKLDINATYGDSEQTPLMLAAETGDCNFVHQILRLHPDLNASDIYDRTVLHYLCEHGLVSAVEYVIDKGVDIDVTDQSRRTSLFLACLSGHKGVVKLLLDRGAAVNVDNYHPLDAACLRGYKQLVPDRVDDDFLVLTCFKGIEQTETVLLDVRTLIPPRDNPFKPLNAACTRGHANIVKTLLVAGAELSGDEVCAACKSGNLDVVKMLFDEGATVNMISKDGQLPLHAACESGKLDVVRVLTGKGANVSMVAPNGNTTLHAACMRGSHEVLLFLLEKLHTAHGEEEEDVFRQQKADINSNIKTRDIPAVNVEDNTRNTPLHGASMCGSKECVDMLLKAGADIQKQDKTGDTPLHNASSCGCQKCVDLLLTAGADVKVQNKTGDTPLHKASGCGSQKCVDMLLKAGAGVNVKNTTGNTPLHGASKRGSKECVDMLLKAGADVNVQNTKGNTPLHFALNGGSKECDDLLLKPRADIQIRDGTGDTPLHNASGCGSQKCVDMLLKAGADVKVQNKTGDTPLHEASECGSQKCVDMLLKAGAIVNVENTTGDTPLHRASKRGSKECVDLLLKASAAIQVHNKRGDTPLHGASLYGSKKCVDMLLKAGADVNVQNTTGDTPLHGASKCRSKECIDLLLQAGAEIQVPNKTGNTPLHAASGCKSKECVDVLLKAGADVNVQNTKGNTPLHFASNRGSKKCVDLLLKTGADVRVQNTIGNTPLHGASNNGSKKCVDLLLEAGADVNVQDTTGNTPLHEASLCGSNECVELLLKAGADIQVQNRKGDTPLHNASRYGSHARVDMLVRAEVKDDTPLLGASMYGSKECVDLLLKAGTDVNVQNTKGNTPLHCASLNGSKKCVELLLKAGADANLQNTTRNTSLHGASLCGSKECVDLLLNAGADTQVRNIQGDTPLLNISR